MSFQSMNRYQMAYLFALIFVVFAAIFPSAGPAQDNSLGVWRVHVASGLTEDDARKRLDTLEGIEGVQVLPYEGAFGIFVGSYPTETEAMEASSELAEMEGVLNQGVAFFAGSADSAPSDSGGNSFRVLVSTHNTEADANEAQRSLEQQGVFAVDVIQKGNRYKVYAGYEYNSRQDAEDYRQNLVSDLGIEVEGIEDPNTMPVATPIPQEAVGQRYARLLREAINSRDIPTAERLLQEWRQEDPNNPSLDAFASEVRQLQPSNELEVSENERYEAMVQSARQAEEREDYDNAIAIWREISLLSGISPERQLEARQEIERLNDKRFAPQPAAPGSGGSQEGGGMSPILIGAIVVVVLVIIAGVAFFVMKSKKKPVPTTSVAAAGAGTLASGGGMPIPKTPVAPAPSPVSKPRSMPTPPAKSQTPSQKAAAAAKKQQGKPQVDGDSPSSGIMLEGMGETPSEEETPAVTTDTPEPAKGEGVKLEGEETPPAAKKKPAADDRAPIPLVRESKPAVPKKKEEAPAAAKKEDQKPAPAVMPDPKTPRPPRQIFYEQQFEDEEVGAVPRNWKGSYDYASLAIAEREGGGKCLRFEKLTGTGSAYYSCRFPDASGRVAVEFDLRCDHKNKYLLGFYVEKDEDFRHSVHTVVHRDIANMEKITLRVQNESTAYELGKWVSVRLTIDLPRSLVDGHVNGEPVAVGVRLASRPKVLNTLSIRDNLATEGILMIDNIRIYQER